MKLLKQLPFFLPALLLVPVIAAAQQTPNLGWFTALFREVNTLVNALIPIVMALALLLFIWGVIQYFILGSEDEDKREAGRSYMLYAIIGLVAIVAVWGIVNLVVQILGVGYGTAPSQPGVPRAPGSAGGA